jgi:hypothetical protein
MVSPHPMSPLIGIAVMLLQSYLEDTPVIEGEVSPISVIVHPLQPRIEEVFVPVQSLVNPTLLVECDESFNHVINIPDKTPSEQEIFFLSPSTPPPSPEEIPFD